MADRLTISAEGVSRRGWRRRTIHTREVRRVHLFTEEDGAIVLVVRGGRLRIVSVTLVEASRPLVHDGLVAFLHACRDHAVIDADVGRFVSSAAGTSAVQDSAACRPATTRASRVGPAPRP